ncbi:hypothetical protein SBADM41S_05572 [Streptomyces badius]
MLDRNNKEIARNENCPGVHGEAAAKNEAVGVGCEDGILIYQDGTFTKIDSPDDYGRIGNQAGSDASPVLLGDYKTDPDAELERPTRVSLIDTEKKKLRLLDLGTSYSFRSLARGPHGEALVLGTDGAIHVITPDTGKIEKKIPVVGEWQEPLDWQQARPTLFVRGQRRGSSPSPARGDARHRPGDGQEHRSPRSPSQETRQRAVGRRRRTLTTGAAPVPSPPRLAAAVRRPGACPLSRSP